MTDGSTGSMEMAKSTNEEEAAMTESTGSDPAIKTAANKLTRRQYATLYSLCFINFLK